MKSMFSPMANGIRPMTVVIAVRITGRNRVFPPSTIASRRVMRSRVRRMSM